MNLGWTHPSVRYDIQVAYDISRRRYYNEISMHPVAVNKRIKNKPRATHNARLATASLRLTHNDTAFYCRPSRSLGAGSTGNYPGAEIDGRGSKGSVAYR